MQDPATSNDHDSSFRIFGQMTVPRELQVRDGMLLQRPVRELKSLRTERIEHRNVRAGSQEMTLDGVSGRSAELIIKACNDGDPYKELRIKFAKNDKYCTELRYRPKQSIVTIDRSRSGQADNIPSQRTIRVRQRNGRISLRILIDRWSSEIFINDGEQVISLTYYTDISADQIHFSADGSVKMDVTMYRLDPGKTMDK